MTQDPKNIPTPRTDAVIREVTVEGSSYLPPHHKTYRKLEYVSTHFARTLERELTLARQENARLKEDKQSMDWLCTCTAGEWESLNNDRLSQRAGKLRQLIKARRDK